MHVLREGYWGQSRFQNITSIQCFRKLIQHSFGTLHRYCSQNCIPKPCFDKGVIGNEKWVKNCVFLKSIKTQVGVSNNCFQKISIYFDTFSWCMVQVVGAPCAQYICNHPGPTTLVIFIREHVARNKLCCCLTLALTQVHAVPERVCL